MANETNVPRIPRRNASCDIRTLPISPAEAYLLSRVDGMLSPSDLAMITGLEATTVLIALERLRGLGAIDWEGSTETTRSARRTQNEVVTEAFAGIRKPVVDLSIAPPKDDGEPPAALYDPAELDEAVELDVDRKRKILDTFYRLEELDHYELLCIESTADKKAIKRAYYALATDYHPDRYFRKNLGSFKLKMEAIFNRITAAQDVLTAKDKRADYDAYIATLKRNKSIEDLLSGRTIAEISEPPPPPAASTPPPGPQAVSLPPSQPATSSAPPRSPRSPSEDERLRRNALARKLMGRGASAGDSFRPAAPNIEAAMQSLKERHESLRTEAHKSKVQRYVEAAKSAALRNDAPAAANFYRLARTLDPDSLEIAAAAEAAAKTATSQLADGYLKQGEYEKKAGRVADAAKSFVRAAQGMPTDAGVLVKAVEALVAAGGDLRRAVDMGRQAVTLDPKRLEARLALAAAYIAAGLKTAAQKEIDAADEISPRDDRIADLVKRMK